MRSAALLAGLVLLLGAASAPAQDYPFETDKPSAKPAAKQPPPLGAPPALTKPAAAKPESKSAGARTDAARSDPAKAAPPSDVFAGIPFGERLKIQSALLWTGDDAGVAPGEDRMLAAIRNFRKRNKLTATGPLNESERAMLVAAAREREQEFGWNVVVDPATGIRIGLPTKMMPHAREAASGTRWSSGYGEVQVETFRIVEPGLKLAALFEKQKNELKRKVEYSVLRDDSFFISGLQGLKKFSVRATSRNGEVRGFTMLFDQAMEGIVAPVVVAMSSAFSPFPERSAPFAPMTKSVEYGNGLVVSAQGHIVTDRKLTEGCQVIVASGFGDAARIADDRDNGLALLRVYTPRQFTPLAIPGAMAKAGDLTLVGIPDPKDENGRKLTEIKAWLTEGSSIELRQPVPMAGFSGAAALDAGGRFAGMMEMRNAQLASAEPSLPPVRLVTASAIRDFLSQHNVAMAAEPGTNAKASIVRMICVRK